MSACTLQLLEFSQGPEKGELMGALRTSSAGRWLVETCAADRQLGRLIRCREGAAKIFQVCHAVLMLYMYVRVRVYIDMWYICMHMRAPQCIVRRAGRIGLLQNLRSRCISVV